MNSMSNDLSIISFDLAPDTELAANVTDVVYQLRLTVKNYIQTGQDKHVDHFNSLSSDLDQLLNRAYVEIQNTERVRMLDNIKALRE